MLRDHDKRVMDSHDFQTKIMEKAAGIEKPAGQTDQTQTPEADDMGDIIITGDNHYHLNESLDSNRAADFLKGKVTAMTSKFNPAAASQPSATTASSQLWKGLGLAAAMLGSSGLSAGLTAYLLKGAVNVVQSVAPLAPTLPQIVPAQDPSKYDISGEVVPYVPQ